jgi:hypothetical protein
MTWTLTHTTNSKAAGLVFWTVVVKVDLDRADDLKLFIHDGGSEMVDCELDA